MKKMLKNCWYPIAWGSEVTAGNLFSRKVCNQLVLLFRNTRDEICAIPDRCPHRFVPLSRGHLCGDTVQCGYHGLEFDGNGQCVHNPHGDGIIPPRAHIGAFPVEERYSLIWIWFGDEAGADSSLIPAFECMNPEKYYVARGYLHVSANYQLETDNILDLSHIQYLHPDTLGSDTVSQAKTRVERDGNTVWSYRQTEAEVLTDYLADAMGVGRGEPVDRWIDVRWDAPACMLLHAGATPTGQSRDAAAETLLPHLFTPETDTTTHYFFAMSVPLSADQGARDFIDEQIAVGLNGPFTNEDLPMLEAQQQAMGDADFWDLRPIVLVGDAAAVNARRCLDAMIEAEAR